MAHFEPTSAMNDPERYLTLEPALIERWKSLSETMDAWRAAMKLSHEEAGEKAAALRSLSVDLAKDAAGRNDLEARSYLAANLLERDLPRVVESLRLKAAAGQIGAQLLLSGYLMVSDPVEAGRWDELLGERARVFWRAGRPLSSSRRVYFSVAQEGLLAGAELGYPLAMERAGDLAIGRGEEDVAHVWYERAAAEGRALAMYSLFELLRLSNTEESRKWLRMASDGGSTMAMLTLASDVAPSDWTEAEFLVRQARTLGDNRAEEIWATLQEQHIAQARLSRIARQVVRRIYPNA